MDRVGSIKQTSILLDLCLAGKLLALVMAFDVPILRGILGRESPALPVAGRIVAVSTGGFIAFRAPSCSS